MCYLITLYFNTVVTYGGKIIHKELYTINAENDSVAIQSISSLLETIFEEEGYTPGEIGCMFFDITKSYMNNAGIKS